MLDISIPNNKQMNQNTNLNEYINDIAATKLVDYVQDRFTEEEAGEYYREEDYNYHLTYLIETWINNIENEFYYDINYNGNFEYISRWFDRGFYNPDFNNEWLDDIFERKILDVVCLK